MVGADDVPLLSEWDMSEYKCPTCKHSWEACVPPSWARLECPKCKGPVLTKHVCDSSAEQAIFARELKKLKDHGVEEASDVWK